MTSRHLSGLLHEKDVNELVLIRDRQAIDVWTIILWKVLQNISNIFEIVDGREICCSSKVGRRL